MVNRRERRAVERTRRGRRLVIGIALTAATMQLACVQIDGGSVELSWSIRDFDGCPSSCDLRERDAACEAVADVAEDLGQVRICWEAVPEDGELALDCGRDPTAFSTFACDQSHGVTGFEIAPGRTAIWIEPLCAGNASPPPPVLYQVPAPIVRDVTTGGVVTLNALLIVAAAHACE